VDLGRNDALGCHIVVLRCVFPFWEMVVHSGSLVVPVVCDREIPSLFLFVIIIEALSKMLFCGAWAL
jgi:hypothetical protein